jgi:uncharacterized membrane protein YbhN (UPF0104 family)
MVFTILVPVHPLPMERQQSRYYKNISLFLKLAIVVLAFGFIYKQVFYRHDREMLAQSLRAAFATPSYALLALSILLMFCNWFIEAWKWKLLVQRSETISFFRSVKAVLSGVTIGAFTPNRFGEFAGRIFYLERTDRIDGILMTFVGSAAQLLVTIVTGSIAFLAALLYLRIPPPYVKIGWALSCVLLVVSIVLVIAYLNVHACISFLKRARFMQRYRSNLQLLLSYSRLELLKVLLLSLLRYCVFTFQFYLLLQVFDVEIAALPAVMLISLTFFAITVIPTFALAELGIRGAAAVAIIGIVADNLEGIIAASFLLWIINIAIPAIAGGFFVFGLKFFKEKR